MLFRQWGAQRAGPAGWLAGLIVAALFFGLTPQVLWVSQLKGLFLSLFVLAVLWPALLLYNVVDQIGGIRALSQGLQRAITDRGLLLIVLAWAFSGMLQGLAGFGLPIAIVAPMLIALDVSPVVAVAAVAIGHSWAVTFGDMGVVFQTLTGLVEIDSLSLAPHAALMLGAACLGCGLSAAYLLGQGRRWLELLVLAALMGIAQYALAVSSVMPLAAFGAGLAGMLGGVLLSRRHNQVARESDRSPIASPSLLGALGSYGALAGLMSAVPLIVPLRTALYPIVWQRSFPAVSTTTGFVTSAGTGQALRPFVHPGSAIFLIACFSYLAYRRLKWCAPGSWRRVAAATWRSAAPATP